MFPVTRKSMISMHKMQKLAPEQAAIKKRYEKEKSAEAQRRMQAEIMELYKKHGVSPLGGCLPMLIQLPMFFALFGMLRNAFELRHEPYLWIRDLTQPEHVVHFGTSVPILGEGLNLLPLVYLGLMLLQQRLQPKPADPQAQQQQKMMRYMFFIFPFLLYNMPSGLILYFVFSNAFGILEQWIIRRHFDDDAPVAAAGGAASVDGKLVGTGTARESRRKTAWDKQDEKQTRRAEKRKKKRDQRDRMGGPGTKQ
jgi:YidC/Oxa1 family membrane protein insertase